LERPVVKTSGKKNRRTFTLLVLLCIAVVALLIRPGLFRDREERPYTERQIPPKKTPPPQTSPKPTPPPPKSAEPLEKAKAKLAVIIDDVGYPSPIFDGYLRFEGKLTFSILPFQPESVNYAQILHRAGFEIMLHIPMEPEDYPQEQPGEGALFVDDSRDDVEEKLKRMIQHTPHVSGANNHMGSLASQNPELMNLTLTILKAEGFYFIDSRTSPRSTAYELSRQLQMKSGNRDVFLDNLDDFAYIQAQFEELKAIARKRGTAIGIGHIQRKNLLEVLNHQMATLQEEGFELVFASEVLQN
jgi:polysaccharide deacetylase 2 family uncharacterized protein YibQ